MVAQFEHLPSNVVKRALPKQAEGELTGAFLARHVISRNHLLGLDALPAARYVPGLLEILKRERSVVVTGPTGCGKSTVAPLAIATTYPGVQVLVAGPRVRNAEETAQWLSTVTQTQVGELVGYHTGSSRQITARTPLTYCTYGLEVMRELLGQNRKERIIVVDEAHMRTIDGDVLLGFLKREQRSNPFLKLVVMSATIDADGFANFLGGSQVIRMTGRPHSIEGMNPEITLGADIVKFVEHGRSIIVCCAGKREVEEAEIEINAALHRSKLNAVVLPFHKEVPEQQQSECFKQQYIDGLPVPRIILATNLGETGLTFEGISVAIDLGYRRYSRCWDGVYGLMTDYATQHEALQFAGRVGRTQPGIFVDRCPIPFKERPVCPQPEILRNPPTAVYLRMAALHKLDPLTVPLMDKPPHAANERIFAELRTLGLFDSSGKSTSFGEEVARLPIGTGVNLGRMLLAARQRKVLPEAAIVAAAMEVGGLQEPLNSNARLRVPNINGIHSDLEYQLLLFREAEHLEQTSATDADFMEAGLSRRNFLIVREEINRIWNRIERMNWTERRDSYNKHFSATQLIEAFAEGFPDFVFVRRGDCYVGVDRVKRVLHSSSLVDRSHQFIVGIPWDFKRSPEDHESQTLRYIRYASEISENMALRMPHIRDLRRAVSKASGKSVEGDGMRDPRRASGGPGFRGGW